jgi:hypothetical protein
MNGISALIENLLAILASKLNGYIFDSDVCGKLEILCALVVVSE